MLGAIPSRTLRPGQKTVKPTLITVWRSASHRRHCLTLGKGLLKSACGRTSSGNKAKAKGASPSGVSRCLTLWRVGRALQKPHDLLCSSHLEANDCEVACRSISSLLFRTSHKTWNLITLKIHRQRLKRMSVVEYPTAWFGRSMFTSHTIKRLAMKRSPNGMANPRANSWSFPALSTRMKKFATSSNLT